MHPRCATLVAFDDAEAGESRSRRIAAHLSHCGKCRARLRRIRSEKAELSAGAAAPVAESRQGLAEVLTAVAAWQTDRTGAGELRRRLRRQMETYFGSPAALMLERPGIRAEELLGEASEVLEVFLGPDAAEAVKDQVLGGLGAWR
jgi:predicted anti-sigma-YlaC factor YlaD